MKKFNIIIFCLSLGFGCFAQDTLITEGDTIITNTGKIEVDQVEVIKDFEAKLIDAKKIQLGPKIEAIIPKEKVYNYDITIVPLDLDYPDPVIKPLAMNPDPAKPISKFYTKLGYGNLNSPFADVSYHDQKGDEYEYTISGHYYGASDSVDIPYRAFYESQLNVDFGYRIGENHQLTLDLGGGYDERFLYDTTVTSNEGIDGESLKRNALKIDVSFGISTIETTENGLDYGIDINSNFIDLAHIQAYNEIGIGSNMFIRKKISNSFSIQFEGIGSHSKISYPSDGEKTRSIFIGLPGIVYTSGNFKVSAAADILFDDQGTNPFVDAKASISALENTLEFFVGVDQEVISNTLWSQYKFNPYVNGFLDISKNTISKQFYGGFSGIVKDLLSFNITAGYEDITDQSYYENFTGLLMFTRYTDMTNIFVNADLGININSNTLIGAKVTQNFYDPTDLDELPNTSAFTYSAFGKVKLWGEKIILTANLDLADKITYETFTGTKFQGNNRTDLGLGVDVFFTENVGLWIRGNNLFDQEYLRFHHYPEFGRNILGGLLVKF